MADLLSELETVQAKVTGALQATEQDSRCSASLPCVGS